MYEISTNPNVSQSAYDADMRWEEACAARREAAVLALSRRVLWQTPPRQVYGEHEETEGRYEAGWED